MVTKTFPISHILQLLTVPFGEIKVQEAMENGQASNRIFESIYT